MGDGAVFLVREEQASSCVTYLQLGDILLLMPFHSARLPQVKTACVAVGRVAAQLGTQLYWYQSDVATPLALAAARPAQRPARELVRVEGPRCVQFDSGEHGRSRASSCQVQQLHFTRLRRSATASEPTSRHLHTA